MSSRRTLRAGSCLGGVMFALLSGACSFEEPASAASLESNVCVVDEDCIGGSCDNGMCAASRAVEPLEVMLEVTPHLSVDSVSAIPIVVGPFDVNGSMPASWKVPAPASVHGRIRQGERIVEADVSFVAMVGLPGMAPRMASTTVTALGAIETSFDYEIDLPSGGEYTLILQPKETGLPPLRRTMDIEGDTDMSVDFDDLELTERTFAIVGTPEDRELLVRAVGGSGEPISSAAHIENGRVTLLFDDAEAPYRIVVRAEESYDDSAAVGGDLCDHDTPVLPTFSIGSDDIVFDENDVGQLVLPPVPSRVRYSGAIELCDDPAARAAPPAMLPVALRSSALSLDRADDAPSAWRAELAVETSATRPPMMEGTRYEFCVDVMPGDYAVVVTPPTDLPCQLFAEQRLIEAPDDENATASLVALAKPATLFGTLTFDSSPVAGAVIDLQSRSLSDTILLDETDASLTNYSRSRQVTSAEDGTFTIAADLGSYDVTVRPQEGSGFAWYVKRDVNIGARGKQFGTQIKMGSPLVVNCSIGYVNGAADVALLENADVRAHALVEGELGTEKRSLAIGSAVVGARGDFTLLLPAQITSGW